ncbi:protein of unknown function [Saccharicrinis carchari]|uniref:YfiR family protein n=1 Tax=Saccharicrinis carchari TaxID=1168039 RepID=A0A521BFP9_SACCC|nr:YfiR family protein [Saccharicrinis carchari]SMO45927.1 protein of unknown function [Saccharicrinis carchari]
MKKPLITAFMIVLSLSLNGQEPMFKALFMFNFAKYIEWPNQDTEREFIIGVYGNDPIIEELNKLASSRKVNNKIIVVRHVSSPSEVPNANIIFLSGKASGNMKQLTSYFKGKPTLIITENTNYCARGAGINYVMQGGKLKFEIKKSNITSHGLNVDPKLISLGIEIN